MGAVNAVLRSPGAFFGEIGRISLGVVPWAERCFGVTGGMWHLFMQAVYFSTIGPMRGESRLRAQLFPLMTNVGVRSLPIVSLVAILMGSILILQTGDVLQQYGQIDQAPGMVALSMTRELGPLMTAIVLIARVGASFTAVLGSMNINDEITALETMAINPIGYLVAPRILAMIVMAPCLVLFAYIVGMAGGWISAWALYDISTAFYIRQSFDFLSMSDVLSGILKAVVFSLLVSLISCYFGLTSKGGPTGLGRNIMVSVVTCLVVVVLADALLTALLINYFL